MRSKNWYEIEEFGNAREKWLRKFLELPNGIPSHDTFGRVFALLDPGVLEEKLMEWVRSVFVKKPEQVIAIDGKTIRGTLDKDDKAFVHMVSAWASENGVSLAQLAVDEKSNEITAMPRLIGMLDIRGAVITSDAMGCQKELAGLIRKKGGDYLLAVKSNQKLLMEGIEESCAMLRARFAPHGNRLRAWTRGSEDLLRLQGPLHDTRSVELERPGGPRARGLCAPQQENAHRNHGDALLHHESEQMHRRLHCRVHQAALAGGKQPALGP